MLTAFNVPYSRKMFGCGWFEKGLRRVSRRNDSPLHVNRKTELGIDLYIATTRERSVETQFFRIADNPTKWISGVTG